MAWKTLLALAVGLLMTASAVSADKSGGSIKVEATGILQTGVVAIGGETTGFTITTNGVTWELEFGKNAELRTAAEKLDGKTVVVEGTLEKRAGVAAGTLETLDVDSRILGNRRTLRIYLPPGYESNTRDYGLLLAYDGNQYTQSVPMPTILDNMIAARVIAPVVASNTSFTSTEPSGKRPSLRYAATAPGDA